MTCMYECVWYTDTKACTKQCGVYNVIVQSQITTGAYVMYVVVL